MQKFLKIRDFARKTETLEEFMEGCGLTELSDNDEEVKLYKDFLKEGVSEEQAAEMAVNEIFTNSKAGASILKAIVSPSKLTSYITKHYSANIAKFKTDSTHMCFCVSNLIKICSLNKNAESYFICMNYCTDSNHRKFEIGYIAKNEFWMLIWKLLKSTDSVEDLYKTISEFICNKIDWKKVENYLQLIDSV